MINIENNINIFIKGRGKNRGRNPNERYASFDYCFNYFQYFREKNIIKELISEKYLQQSCLQLAFYLANWGMLRGSSFLLEKSIRNYTALIKGIVGFDKKIWDIDVNSYNEENINLLLKCKEMIHKSFDKKSSDILITKIMLGVFGNIPAFDGFFKQGFHFSACNRSQLKKIAKFYKDNDKIIDKYSNKIYTYDFSSGKETKRNYTKAKIIDMVGFIEGQNKN